MTEKKLFKRYRIDPLNFVSVGICLLFSIYFFTIKPVEFDTRKQIVFYSFGLYFFTLFFNYRALRNLNIWFIWAGLALIQVILYYRHGLNKMDWPAVHGLRNFWIFLVAFQILRWFSLKFQKKEFVALARNKRDMLDERKLTRLDVILFLPAIFLIFLLQGIKNYAQQGI
nr:hypothetical protein [Allomuricauda sp.]